MDLFWDWRAAFNLSQRLFIFCCRLATIAFSGGNGLIALALGLTDALPAVAAFSGLGAVGFSGKLYWELGNLVLGLI
jgi:hypothetical protein